MKSARECNREGVRCGSLGRLQEAIDYFKQALELEPGYTAARYNLAVAYNNLGSKFQNQGKEKEAVRLYRQALKFEPDYAEAEYNLGNWLAGKGKLGQAAEKFRRAVKLKKDFFQAYFNLGVVRKKQGKFQAAMQAFRKCVQINPSFAIAYLNLGILLRKKRQMSEAILNFRKALEFKPDLYEAYNSLGNALIDEGEIYEAIGVFQRALEAKPDYAEVYANLANALKYLGRRKEALKLYRQAIELNPKMVEPYNNLGVLLTEMKRFREAVAVLQRGLRLKQEAWYLYYNLGLACKYLERFRQSIVFYRKALSLKPDYSKALTHLVHQLAQVCDWGELVMLGEKLDQLTKKELREGSEVGETPFISVVRSDNKRRNLEVAQAWSKFVVKRMASVKRDWQFLGRKQKKKLTIGYVSDGFGNFPTAQKMLSLFGLHDRRKFKVHVYSYGKNDGSSYFKKIRQDCDKFVDVTAMSFKDAAEKIWRDKVDVLVDLKGHTRDSRLEIFALQPAPLQVSWLGFPGTTGASFIDYLLVDLTVVPQSHRRYYTENLVYLPDTYQVNDYRQKISGQRFTRKDFGLLSTSFVFSSFNDPYKVNSEIFELWLRVLKQIPGSVLWLWQTNRLAAKNLKREAEKRQVDCRRLIFAETLEKKQHLRRLQLSDLALDTKICNGHTTTSDCLWAGVPVVTLKGNHFASRVSASLLKAIGLEELITHSLKEYEALAISLAKNPKKLMKLKAKLKANKKTYPLFDTKRFTRNLEKAYVAIWERHRKGLKPRQITIKDSD